MKFLVLFAWLLVLWPAHGFSRPIRMAYTSRSLAFLPAFFAVEEGFFKREGLDVTLIQMRSNLGVVALVNREVDYTLSYGGTLEAALKGLPIKVLMVLSDTPHYFVSAKAYPKVQDLKGRIIGVNRLGGSNEYVITKVMEHFGIRRDEIKIMALGDEPIRRVALEKGLIAATVLAPPGPVLARKAGLHVLLWVGEVVFSPQSLLATTTGRIDREMAEVRSVVRALAESLAFIRKPANKERVSAFLSRYFALAPQDAGESLQLILPALVKDGIMDESKVKLSMQDAARWEPIQVPPKPSEIFDFSLAREMAKQ
jgi:NitT/TauT family transport system substrate-binding protein